MSALFDKLLGVFRRRNPASSLFAPTARVTIEQVAARLQHRNARPHPQQTVPCKEGPLAGIVRSEAMTPQPGLSLVDQDVVDGAQQVAEERRPGAAFHAGQPVADAADEHVDAQAVPVAAESDTASIVVTNGFRADEAAHLSVPDRKADNPATYRPVPEARPAEEIPEEFHAYMRSQFGHREEPTTVAAAPDVLKVLGLDRDEAPRTIFTEPEPEPETVSPRLSDEPDIAIEMSHDPETAAEPIAVGDEERAPTLWKARTVGEVMLKGDCSVRLSNCIAANQGLFSGWTIGMALTNRSLFTSALMHVRNIGRKTANEALDALEAFALDSRFEEDEPAVGDPCAAFDPTKLDASIRSVLGRHHVSVRLARLLATGAVDDLTVREFFLQPDRVRARMMRCKNAGRKTVTEAFELLTAHVETLGQPNAGSLPVQAEDEPPEGITTREWIEREIASLPPNRIEVLHSRYGLDGRKPETLQEIAERVHVTRERVRQVEAGAIRRLRKDARSCAAFKRFLAVESDVQWAMLFGPQSSLPDDEVSDRFRKLDPWFQLAIDIVFEDGRDGYLNANASKTATGWFKSADEAEDRQELDHLLGDIVGAYQTPMPLDTLEEITPSAMVFIPGTGDHWAVHDGYIFTGHVGPKARRAARMHSVARRISKSGLFDMGTLIAEYRSEFPADECGSRSFDIEASGAPHLFARLFDCIWLCIDRPPRQAPYLREPPFERARVEERRFISGSDGDLLTKKLKASGPQRLIDLKEAISGSAGGIGAVLKQNPCFRRIAPGIFDLYTGAEEFPASLDHLLVEERHCRTFCHARHSGAPSGYYPAWGAAYEKRLSSWAQRHAPPDLYHSLMAVIEPEYWPATPETIAEFQALRRQDGRWQIGASRRNALGHRFLDAAQFFAILTHLVAFGWIGWFAVNRLTGTISSNQHAADVLAFLVMTGLIEPESDWQALHRPTDLAKRLFLEARWERHLHGDESSGDEGVFGQLRSALYDAPPNASLGWVDVDEFRGAMSAWRTDRISTGKAFGGAQARQPGINAEESFESDDWDTVFGG